MSKNSEKRKYRKYGTSKKHNFRIVSEVGVPHPYMVTEKHLEYNQDQMYLGKEQIEEMEKEHGNMCGFKCGMPWSEHKIALMVECTADIHTKTGKMNRELQTYLKSIKDKTEKNGYAGFAFLDKREIKRQSK